MIRSCAPCALLCAFLLLALAACDDPTDVGGELIQTPNAGPQRLELPVDVEEITYAPLTGTALTTTLNVSRLLAGRADGSPLADVEATGYVDFVRGGTPEDFSPSTRTIDTVEVSLAPDYFYGDTTQAATFALYDLTEEWEAADAPADTSLDIAENTPITTFSAASSDTLVTVQLPAAWVREHDDELLAEDDSTFIDEFHGFQIRPANGGASVVGFTSSSISMRAVFEEEDEDGDPQTASYGIARQLTTIQQPSGAPSLPEDRSLIQDGIGRTLAFEFNLPDSLRDASVNSASLIFEVDTTLAAGDDVARPPIDVLELYSVPADGEGEPTLQRGAQFTFDASESRFTSAFPLITFVQDILLSADASDTFQVRPAAQTVQTPFGSTFVPVPSLDSRVIRRDEGHEPRLVLTYTPTTDE